MPSVNMRGLRDTVKLKTWLRQGKTVELRDRDRVIGRIVPETEQAAKEVVWPDFQARLDKIFKGKKLNAVDDFLKERHRY